MESTSLWKPVPCPAPTNQNAMDQNGFKHKERVKMLIWEEGGTRGLVCRALHLRRCRVQLWVVSDKGIRPFWADQVWSDLVADVLTGSSKVAQALIVAIRYRESRQKRGSDCTRCLFRGPELLPRAAWAPPLHTPSPSSKSIISVEAHPGLDDVLCLSGRALLSLANIY